MDEVARREGVKPVVEEAKVVAVGDKVEKCPAELGGEGGKTPAQCVLYFALTLTRQLESMLLPSRLDITSPNTTRCERDSNFQRLR